MDVYNIKQEGVETVSEFLARGGKITYVKGNKTNNFCPYCEVWGSIKRYYSSKYSTKTQYNREWGCFEEWIIQTKVLKYSRCQCCHKIISDYIKKEDRSEL